MVDKVPPVCLLVGPESPQKEEKISSLKDEFLPSKLREFNLDTLYARDLTLKLLQERLLALPIKSGRRMVIVREAERLNEETRKFILSYCLKPQPAVILVLDVAKKDAKDEFCAKAAKYAKVFNFLEARRADTFGLWRQIASRRADNALKTLSEILKNGEKPERIIGGLRYSCEKDASGLAESKRRLRLLIDCDLEIKTGRVKPVFALEKLVIGLCGLG